MYTDVSVDRQVEYRKLPAVDSLLRLPAIHRLVDELGVEWVTAAVRAELADVRQSIAAGTAAPAVDLWPERVRQRLEQSSLCALRPLINATGVVIHTNLGRAPLSDAALAAVQAVSVGYSNLEYDLADGGRGSRHDHARHLLCELTGAEDAMVVNNNAAAIYLVLSALCAGSEVLLSRSQLVEIGGGFRIPDVLRQSGARLVEVGTTNRTHSDDFTQAVTAASAAILRVHSSNFKQIGFVAMPALSALATLAHQHGLLLIDDLGSGTLLETTPFGLSAEPLIQQSVAAGADLITFSGDKLLGGPQAGLILGRAGEVARLRRHPLARALRVDKLTLAALEATLLSYRRGRALQEIPVWQMIAASPEELAARARRWQATLAAQGFAARLHPGFSTVGGGALPGETQPTTLLAISHATPDRVAAALRSQPVPVVCRIQQDQLLFDPRTVLAGQEGVLLQGLLAVLQRAARQEETGCSSF